MRIYGSSMSPFVRKVLVFCAEKGVPMESVPIGLGSDDEEFRRASPLGKMPAMVDGDYRLADSSAIIHYVEARHPEPALIPADPQERGRAIWFEEYADTILSGCGAKMFFNRVVAPMFLKREGDLAAADRAEREELPAILDYLEAQIGDGNYLVGDRLSVADIAIGTSLPNLEHCGHQIEATAYPRLAAYQARFSARPSVEPLLARERAYFARVRG
jgi:glutathione S-transferase